MSKRKLDLRPVKISKAQRIATALSMRADGKDFVEIGKALGLTPTAARKLVGEGLALRKAENAELAGLAREEEINKLDALYLIERAKAETFKMTRPDVSTQAVKNCITIARRRTQLLDGEPAIRVDVHEVFKATRTRMQSIVAILAKHLDAETILLIENDLISLDARDDLSRIHQRVIEAEARRVDGNGNGNWRGMHDPDEDDEDDEDGGDA